MEHTEFFPVITERAGALAEVARRSDLDARVPSCPEWDVAKLVRHTGTAHRWSSGVVKLRSPCLPSRSISDPLKIPTGLP